MATGNRVKKVENSETTVYVNRYYEKNVTTGVSTSYYYLGGKLVALKKGSDFRLVGTDHLGSTTTVLDSTGAPVSSTSFEPFGDRRISQGTMPTDKLFTGQRLDGTGLYFYNARYYDPTIGRFISADMIVPDAANPQTFNRYSYVLNNPLKYNDPSGHKVVFTGDDKTLLEDAWALYAVADPDLAKAMIDSDEVYSFSWTADDAGGASYTLDFVSHYMFINKGDKGNLIQAATHMAHESFHAREGRQSDSVQEEVGAYQYESKIGNLLNSWSSNQKANVDYANHFNNYDLTKTGKALETDLKDAKNLLTGGPNNNNRSPTQKMYASLSLTPPKNPLERFVTVLGMMFAYIPSPPPLPYMPLVY